MKKSASLYPEHIAISYNDLNLYNEHYIAKGDAILNERLKDSYLALSLNQKLENKYQNRCVTGVSVGTCGKHFFYKPVHCGKESCRYCGEDNSQAHKRRVSRVIDQVRTWKAVSYFVITVPEEARNKMKTRQALNDFRNFVRRKLKRDGFTTALVRWHYAGKCNHCGGGKVARLGCVFCQGTGCGDTWEPHLNILLPAGNTKRTTKSGKIKDAVTCYDYGRETLKSAYIDSWRLSLSDWFRENHSVDSVGNFYHNFIAARDKDKKQKVNHRVRYIMRATLRNEALADEMSETLKRYKTTTHIGIWKKAKEERLPIACPCCGGELSWYRDVREKWYSPGKTLIEVETGLYYLDWHES